MAYQSLLGYAKDGSAEVVALSKGSSMDAINTWALDAYRNLKFYSPTTGDLNTWLQGNAVKMPLEGTYVFNSKPTSSSNWGANVNFTCNGTAYTNLSWSTSTGLLFQGTVVYDLDTTSWGNTAYRTITFTSPVQYEGNEEFVRWFVDNAAPPPPPVMAKQTTWYKGTTAKSAITEIELKDSYTPTETIVEQWNADENDNGDIKCYIIGTKLYIVGNGTGKIMANANSSYLFTNFSKVISISGMKLLDTSQATAMHAMFEGCVALISLDISNFNTSQVTNMYNMFYKCQALTNLDISNFDTSQVTDMYSMFYQCYALTNLDISNFDTSQVTRMKYMFSQCYALTSLDVSNFDTSKVTDMYCMFQGCRALTSLDVSNFDTSKVTDMKNMFYACRKLSIIYVSDKWSIENVTSSEYMFDNCTSLVGAVPYDSTKTDASMANYTTGYLTLKQS